MELFMKKYVTIDGGTTNTRASLVIGGDIQSTVKIPIGAKKSIGGNEELKNALKAALDKLLSEAGYSISDIDAILASGMITSEFGLVDLPHITAPAGIAELARNMESILVPEVAEIPINFVRGVKTVGELELTDMMRGEETELMGLREESYGECVFVLPGSHSKLIYTDREGRITRFSTTLTGEMIAALSEGTILKDAVSLSCEKLDTPSLDDGFLYARERGLNEALFKTRILKNLFGRGEEECYSFFLGAVLADEINTIISSPATTVVIGGRAQIKKATAHLCQKHSDKKVIAISDEAVAASTAKGIVRIFEYGKT